MSVRDDGGRAFPALEEHGLNNGCYGLTIRDYFAAQAMTMVDALGQDCRINQPDELAAMCYEMADAMLAERAK